jgi:polysaccharide deacetylase 2 family uncharacterized protein YibQ
LARFHQIFLAICRAPALPWSAVVLVVMAMASVTVAGLGIEDQAPPAPFVGSLMQVPIAASLPPPPDHAMPAPAEDHAAVVGQEPATPEAAGTQVPGIALLLTGFGLDPVLTRAASELPRTVAFAWSVYADDPLPGQAAVQRQGREVWLELPVSRGDPARFDQGPLALSPARSDERNLERLTTILSRGSGLSGVVAEPGAFAPSPVRFRPLALVLQQRRLPLLLHGDFAATMAGQAGWGGAGANGSMGPATRADTIDRFLDQLASRANEDGRAIGVMRAHPLTIARILRWQHGIAAQGLTLVPPSTLLHAPLDPMVAVKTGPLAKGWAGGPDGHGG